MNAISKRIGAQNQEKKTHGNRKNWASFVWVTKTTDHHIQHPHNIRWSRLKLMAPTKKKKKEKWTKHNAELWMGCIFIVGVVNSAFSMFARADFAYRLCFIGLCLSFLMAIWTIIAKSSIFSYSVSFHLAFIFISSRFTVNTACRNIQYFQCAIVLFGDAFVFDYPCQLARTGLPKLSIANGDDLIPCLWFISVVHSLFRNSRKDKFIIWPVRRLFHQIIFHVCLAWTFDSCVLLWLSYNRSK